MRNTSSTASDGVKVKENETDANWQLDVLSMPSIKALDAAANEPRSSFEGIIYYIIYLKLCTMKSQGGVAWCERK
jgi:hypothetical protein